MIAASPGSRIRGIIGTHREIVTGFNGIEGCTCGESKGGVPGWYREHLAELVMKVVNDAVEEVLEPWEVGGLPRHLPMGVDAAGGGPVDDSKAHHWACWCGDPNCVWTKALALDRQRVERVVKDVMSREGE